MIICGISIAASEAILVWIDGNTRAAIDGMSTKVSLSDPYSKQDLKQTSEVFRQLFAERKTELIVVRKSSTSGKFSAGHECFRIETIICLTTSCDVVFVSPQGVASFLRKEAPVMPVSLKKYQHDAYCAILTFLADR